MNFVLHLRCHSVYDVVDETFVIVEDGEVVYLDASVDKLTLKALSEHGECDVGLGVASGVTFGSHIGRSAVLRGGLVADGVTLGVDTFQRGKPFELVLPCVLDA